MGQNYERLVLNLWSKYKEYNMAVLTFKSDKTISKHLIPRRSNVPEIISQYFAYKILKNKLEKNVTLNNTRSSADLLINKEFVEIKAGINGPSSLATKDKWEVIKHFYFLDCSCHLTTNIFYLYEVDWCNLKSYLGQKHNLITDEKRRLKYTFFDSPYCNLVWNGTFNDIFRDV